MCTFRLVRGDADGGRQPRAVRLEIVLSPEQLRLILDAGCGEIPTMDAAAAKLGPESSLRIGGSGPTVKALLVEYEAHLRSKDDTEGHVADYIRFVREAAEEMGWTFAGQITPAAVTTHLLGRKTRGNGSRQRNHALAAIRAFCRWAVHRKFLADDPTISIAKARVPKGRARVVPTPSEVAALIIAASADWRKKNRWLRYLTAAVTGLRGKTLEQMTVSCVCFADGLGWFELDARWMKNGREAKVWMSSELARHMSEYVRGRPPNELLFSHLKQEGFDRDLACAGLAKRDGAGRTLSPHSLRHFASHRLDHTAAFTLHERQSQMTHETSRMTLEVYSDRESEGFGRRVWMLPDLLPDGFTPQRPPRERGTGTGDCGKNGDKKDSSCTPDPTRYDAAPSVRSSATAQNIEIGAPTPSLGTEGPVACVGAPFGTDQVPDGAKRGGRFESAHPDSGQNTPRLDRGALGREDALFLAIQALRDAVRQLGRLQEGADGDHDLVPTSPA